MFKVIVLYDVNAPELPVFFGLRREKQLNNTWKHESAVSIARLKASQDPLLLLTASDLLHVRLMHEDVRRSSRLLPSSCPRQELMLGADERAETDFGGPPGDCSSPGRRFVRCVCGGSLRCVVLSECRRVSIPGHRPSLAVLKLGDIGSVAK
jgi:hypothetical protein